MVIAISGHVGRGVAIGRVAFRRRRRDLGLDQTRLDGVGDPVGLGREPNLAVDLRQGDEVELVIVIPEGGVLQDRGEASGANRRALVGREAVAVGTVIGAATLAIDRLIDGAGSAILAMPWLGAGPAITTARQAEIPTGASAYDRRPVGEIVPINISPVPVAVGRATGDLAADIVEAAAVVGVPDLTIPAEIFGDLLCLIHDLACHWLSLPLAWLEFFIFTLSFSRGIVKLAYHGAKPRHTAYIMIAGGMSTKELIKEFGHDLQAAREARGLSRRELAVLAKTSHQTVRAFEAGEGRRLDLLIAIARRLDRKVALVDA